MSIWGGSGDENFARARLIKDRFKAFFKIGAFLISENNKGMEVIFWVFHLTFFGVL